MRNDDWILIDPLLAKLCVLLQLTQTQHNAAERSYGAVGEWLGGDGSPLAVLDSDMYPQGSMALLTTVRPRGRVEYDLDFIFQVAAIGIGPMELYNFLLKRLRQHADYKARLVQDPLPRRCLRLNYSGQFHLDVVPARIDPIRRVPFIQVPDRELKKWVSSNPIGYRKWFEEQCARTLLIEKAAQEPLPARISADRKPILTRIVQLFKRHRDVVFDNRKDAPSSMVITTLSGTFYRGSSSLLSGLEQVLGAVVGQIAAAQPRRISLCNPANADEYLMDGWSDERYREFVGFIQHFYARIRHLSDVRGLDAIGGELKELFSDEIGEERGIIAKAVREYMEDRVRDAGSLRFGPAGLSLATGKGMTIRPHRFYGR
jgi:hypothetical protein